jgi:hypothetical protein
LPSFIGVFLDLPLLFPVSPLPLGLRVIRRQGHLDLFQALKESFGVLYLLFFQTYRDIRPHHHLRAGYEFLRIAEIEEERDEKKSSYTLLLNIAFFHLCLGGECLDRAGHIPVGDVVMLF